MFDHNFPKKDDFRNSAPSLFPVLTPARVRGNIYEPQKPKLYHLAKWSASLKTPPGMAGCIMAVDMKEVHPNLVH